MFKIKQYEEAIANLQLGLEQHKSGNHQMGCDICGDAHGVDECGWNPLYAMMICQSIAEHSNELHDLLHGLAGYTTVMGESSGPAKVVMPSDTQSEVVE